MLSSAASVRWGCRTRTNRSTTSEQVPEPKLNAANAVVVDSFADADAHDLGELLGEPRPLVPEDVVPSLMHDGAPMLMSSAGSAR